MYVKYVKQMVLNRLSQTSILMVEMSLFVATVLSSLIVCLVKILVEKRKI